MKKLFVALRILALAVFLICALFPLYWTLVTSLKGPTEMYTYPITYWPKHITFENYRYLLKSLNFTRYTANSVFVSLFSALIALIVASFSGYVLARKQFLANKVLFFLLFITQIIPGFMLMSSIYVMFGPIGLVDNLFVLIFLYTGIMVPFSSIMMKGFFERIPESIEEAALIDGCKKLQMLFKVVFPVTAPGLAATFCFAFVNCWNELFLAIMLLNSESKKTIPVGLNSFVGKADIDWGAMAAGVLIALLPAMLIFAFAQKYIVQGLTQGAVKE
ncbi:MAG TPA: carbohydrate ABC transporter permease [Pseudothermotoga sp.]|uniref:carbohydrate ABC transporter permease n=1 Tax=Thermotoga profunda TaxID=1508420 RepID=UPI0005978881|nr:carbohydrate ABC transporter permease [Thermotoga profunda]